jgi:murein DD-endopeptidase MepM/ murein hydrolase activator NlpD
MSNKKSNGAWRGKGYYIALILCAAAIGISGYVFYASDGEDVTLQDTPVAATDPVRTNPTEGTPPAQTSPSEATRPAPGKLAVCAPVEGSVAAEYAMEVLSYNQTTRDWRVHNGVDILAQSGTQVVAAADGEVYTVYEDGEMGMTVVIRHEGGYTTKYASLADTVSVSAGQTVTMGQPIGSVGSTALMESALGDHVHFSVTCNDEPMDPEEFLAME